MTLQSTLSSVAGIALVHFRAVPSMVVAIVVCACLTVLAFAVSRACERETKNGAARAAFAKRGHSQRGEANPAAWSCRKQTLDDLRASRLETRRPSRENVIQPEPEAAAPCNEPTVEDTMPESFHTQFETSNEALTARQRILAAQREAAEALLHEACLLEARLESEVQAARAAEEYETAKAKTEAVMIQEQQARALAQAGSDRRTALAAELKKAEALVAATRPKAEAASDRIAVLEQQLRDARKLAEESLYLVKQHEANVSICNTKLTAADREAHEAAVRITELQNARAAAENEAAAARKRAEALTKDLPGAAQPYTAINDVQALAARIAEQVSTLSACAANASLSVLRPATATLHGT
jgi:hypothetical protein